MKLNKNVNEVFTNTEASKGFAIEASAMAFQILSSQIYENKIKAIVRELSCNAYDSHVAANKKDEPFTVHLPNSFEPWFEVSDKGVGLSEDQVFNLYTTYFKSSKQDSDDFIGGLGLGSKSPFSYVDQFTVVSTYDGVKTTYSAFVGTEGAPQITKVHSTKSNLDNGVMVRLPVKNQDFNNFANEARNVLKWFEVTPHIVGNKIEIKNVRLNDSYYFSEEVSYGYDNFVALMGNVAYPTKMTNQRLNTVSRSARGTLVVNFDIGELSVSASRESLSLDEITQQNIQDRLDEIAKSILIDMQTRVDNCSTLLDISKIDCASFVLNNREKFTYNGKLLKEYSKPVKDVGYLNTIRRNWGRKNKQPTRLEGYYSAIDPFSGKIAVMIMDSNKYVQYNRNEFYNEHYNTDDVAHLFECLPEKVKDAETFLEYCDVTFEKLSDRIVNGCKPERKKGSSGQSGIIYYALNSRSSANKERDTLKNIKDSIKNHSDDVYAMSIDFRNAESQSTIDRIQEAIPEKTTLYIVNSSACCDIIEKTKAKPVREMPAGEDFMKSLNDYIENIQYVHAVNSFYYSELPKGVAAIESLLGVSNDYTKHYLKLYHMKNDPKYDTGSSQRYRTVIEELDCLKQYEGKLSRSEVKVSEIIKKYNDFKKYINKTYPLLGLKGIVEADSSLHDDIKLYIMAKNEEMKQEEQDAA